MTETRPIIAHAQSARQCSLTIGRLPGGAAGHTGDYSPSMEQRHQTHSDGLPARTQSGTTIGAASTPWAEVSPWLNELRRAQRRCRSTVHSPVGRAWRRSLCRCTYDIWNVRSANRSRAQANSVLLVCRSCSGRGERWLPEWRRKPVATSDDRSRHRRTASNLFVAETRGAVVN
jgi:hypothetical protein